MNMSIRENIQQVRENIAAAALSAGRRPEDITLVGGSKMNDTAACREAIAAGIDALGENRVKEMTQKLLRRRASALHRSSPAQQGEAGRRQGRAHRIRRLL